MKPIKKRLLLLMILSYNCSVTHAQIVINLFDSSNKMPIPYCSVIIGKSVFFSDFEGKVSIENKLLVKDDSIHFNRIGYQSTVINSKLLLTSKSIALTPILYKLSEVQIKPLDLPKLITLLSKKYTANVASGAYQAKAYFVSTIKYNGIYKKFGDSYMHLFSFGNIDKFFKGNDKDIPLTVGLHLRDYSINNIPIS